MENKPKGETDLCRNRLLKYCNGQGLDLGCGNTRIRPEAIAIDLYSPEADMKIDARLMPCYKDSSFDYIYSSHLLEEIEDTESTLKEWLRIIKDGGYLVLYQADKDLYYPLGHPNCNQMHKHHFNWEELWNILNKIRGVKLIHHNIHTETKEWSFELVVQKIIKNDSEGISIIVPIEDTTKAEDLLASIDRTIKSPDVEIILGVSKNNNSITNNLKNKFKIPIKIIVYDNLEEVYENAKYSIIGHFMDSIVMYTIEWEKRIINKFEEDKNLLIFCNNMSNYKDEFIPLFFTHKSVHQKAGYYYKENNHWYNIYKEANKLFNDNDIIYECLPNRGSKMEQTTLIEGEGISILIPTLNRPDNIERFSLSIENTTTNYNKIEILFGIHEDDIISKQKIEELKLKLKTPIRYELIERFSDNKIHLSFLWNQLYKKSKYPILGYFGDDVVFKTPGWDIEVQKEFQKDKTILFACNDVHCQMGAIATLFFTHKIVHEKIGFYLNMTFRRWFMDTFWDHVYKNAGKFRYRADIITEHIHPDKFPEVADSVYHNMEHFKNDDRIKWDSEENRNEIAIYAEIIRNIKQD